VTKRHSDGKVSAAVAQPLTATPTPVSATPTPLSASHPTEIDTIKIRLQQTEQQLMTEIDARHKVESTVLATILKLLSYNQVKNEN